MTNPHMRALSHTLAALAVLLICAALVFISGRAFAAFQQVTETGTPGFLQLSVDTATPLRASLKPGDTMRWQVKADLQDAHQGTLHLDLQSSGEFAEQAGLTAEILACSEKFDLTAQTPHCAGTTEEVLASTLLSVAASNTNRLPLADLHQGQPRYLLVTFYAPTSGSSVELSSDATAEIGLGVHSSGNSDATPPDTPLPIATDTPLPITGADMVAVSLLTLGLLTLGFSAVLTRKLRSHTAQTVPSSPAQSQHSTSAVSVVSP